MALLIKPKTYSIKDMTKSHLLEFVYVYLYM